MRHGNGATKERRQKTRPHEEPLAKFIDVDTERQLCGSLIALGDEDQDKQKQAIKDVRSKPSDFVDQAHQLIFEHIKLLHDRGFSVNYPNVCTSLREAQAFDVSALKDAGGPTYVFEVVRSGGTGLDWAFYDSRVAGNSRKRQQLISAEAFVAACRSGDDDQIETVKNGLIDHWQHSDDGSESGSSKYHPIGLTELIEINDQFEYLIPGVMVADEIMVIGGAEKSLKTSISMDLVLSLASGSPFLGYFAVPAAVNVAIMSGESGRKSLSNLARRIVAERGIYPEVADERFLFTSEIPELDDPSHAKAVVQFVERNELRVLLIDPMYLCFEATADDAHNAKKIGPLLRKIVEPCQRMGCTICLVEHALRGNPSANQPITIHNLPTTASKFARQYMLLSRRSEYQDDGRHELWMRAGGSAGHTGCWGLDIHEGTIETGRKWEVSVKGRRESVEQSREARAEAAAQRKRQKAEEESRAVREALLAAFRSLGGKAETKVNLSNLAGHRGRVFDGVLAELIRTKQVVPEQVVRSNGQKYDGYALRRDSH